MEAGEDNEISIDEPQATHPKRDNTVLDDFLETFQLLFTHILTEHKAAVIIFVVIAFLSSVIMVYSWLADNIGGIMARLFNRSIEFLGDKTKLSFLKRLKFNEIPVNAPKTSIRPSREQVKGEFQVDRRVRKESGGFQTNIPNRRASKPDHKLVFISYRRDKGSQMARIVKSEIEKRNYSVYLDVDDFGPDLFHSILLKQIEAAPNFIVILAPGSLDRCVNEADWLRREIAYAIKTERNIIPIMFDGFQFPSEDFFPEDISRLIKYNGVVYSHYYHEATFNKLLGFFRKQ